MVKFSNLSKEAKKKVANAWFTGNGRPVAKRHGLGYTLKIIDHRYDEYPEGYTDVQQPPEGEYQEYL